LDQDLSEEALAISIPSMVSFPPVEWKTRSTHLTFLDAVCSYSGVSTATLFHVIDMLAVGHPLKFIYGLAPSCIAKLWAATTGICVVAWVDGALSMNRLFPRSLSLFSQGPV
jgi:hypothetical protein